MNSLYNMLPDTIEERLETDHLLLRPYQEGDENDFMRLIQENTVELNPAFSGRLARVRLLEDARLQVQQLRTAWDNHKMFDFGVWLKESGTYIGDITLSNLDRQVPKAEIGVYFTGWPKTKVYMEEGLAAIVKFGFDLLKLNKLYMRCTLANAYYGEAAQTCGFVKEGVLRCDYRGADSEELLDVVYFGLTRRDYERLQSLKAGNTEALA